MDSEPCHKCLMYNCQCSTEVESVKLEERTNDAKILYLLQNISIRLAALEQVIKNNPSASEA